MVKSFLVWKPFECEVLELESVYMNKVMS